MDTNVYKVILTDVALEELNEIYKYIHKHLDNKSAAEKLMGKVEKTILALGNNSYMCAEVHIKKNDGIYRKAVVDNYIALYDVEEELKKVVIYRVLYSGRNYLKLL